MALVTPPDLSPDHAPVTLHPRRRLALALLAASVALAVVGRAAAAEGRVVGWVALGFFGLCALVFAIVLLPGSAYLRLDSRGFTTRNLFRKGRLRWRDVRNFRPYSVPGGTFVGFDFTEASGSLGRVSARKLAGVDGGLPDTYGLEPEELAAVLNAWRDRYGET